MINKPSAANCGELRMNYIFFQSQQVDIIGAGTTQILLGCHCSRMSASSRTAAKAWNFMEN